MKLANRYNDVHYLLRPPQPRGFGWVGASEQVSGGGRSTEGSPEYQQVNTRFLPSSSFSVFGKYTRP